MLERGSSRQLLSETSKIRRAVLVEPLAQGLERFTSDEGLMTWCALGHQHATHFSATCSSSHQCVAW